MPDGGKVLHLADVIQELYGTIGGRPITAPHCYSDHLRTMFILDAGFHAVCAEPET